MKIAHISHTDGGAGAGRAAYRIHRSLLDLGVDSSMFVSDKRTADATVLSVAEGRIARTRARVCEYFEAKLARRETGPNAGFFSQARFGHFVPAGDVRIRSADVVCLYWINGGYVTPEDLTGLSQPVVWRLSDVWPFTGGCHYPSGCEHYTKGCGDCPQLARASRQDRSSQLWRRKLRAWRTLDLTIVAPSEWIAGLARKSALFSDRRIVVIPTGVDLDRYRPQGNAKSRSRFGIPQDKLVIMFGAMSPGADARKGFAQLHAALQILACGPLAGRLLAVVFGSAAVPEPALPIPAINLGHLNDDEALAAAYSSADLMVVPSLEDNLPNVALEAIACGAPVVGFDVCGMPDIVRHGWNGALAVRPDAGLLAAEIARLLADSAGLSVLASNARAMAVTCFSLKQQADSYLRLYRELAERKRAATRQPG